MEKRIRILLLEDNPSDSELIQTELRQGGIQFISKLVDNRNDFVEALRNFNPQIILSDYSLPSFCGLEALAIAHSKYPDIPFIFVSGQIGEELAIETLKEGCVDYVFKERLSRLVPSVKRALRETEEKVKLKETEEKLIQSQKMEALGKLAGGIAHDFNNILQAISLASSILINQMDPKDPLRPHVQEIKEAGESATALTHQLLAFGRKQMLQPKVIDLNDILSKAEPMLSRLVGENIEISIIHGEKIGKIKADPTQIGQVIWNLAINARDAMSHGGKLSIETQNVSIDKNFIGLHPEAKEGNYATLLISDAGCGMSAEVKAHLFEPFFTTKETGKGVGLGLSISYGIVKQSGGFLDVESEVGKGTTFKIYFPQTEEKEKVERPTQPSPIPTGRETILLVEDNEMVRNLLGKVLHLHGYSVIEAKDGEEALKISEQSKEPVHLVITDIIMPKMGGIDLARCLLEKKPETKIIYISGYIDVGVRPEDLIGGQSIFLQKPFSPETLARKVQELLHPEKK
ncbi:MAG TPA: response regulator [Bdellovibrionota bacterium]|nr:response regulator [Bdellovibrionota bacterium]